jgi:hypothetical protein
MCEDRDMKLVKTIFLFVLVPLMASSPDEWTVAEQPMEVSAWMSQDVMQKAKIYYDALEQIVETQKDGKSISCTQGQPCIECKERINTLREEFVYYATQCKVSKKKGMPYSERNLAEWLLSLKEGETPHPMTIDCDIQDPCSHLIKFIQEFNRIGENPLDDYTRGHLNQLRLDCTKLHEIYQWVIERAEELLPSPSTESESENSESGS